MTNGDDARTMQIELTIKTDYMPAWGLWEGVRELIQNAKDGETQLHAKMSVEHDPATSTLTVTNDGVTLPHEALLLGHTTKLGDKNTIGQFGEGLKIGLLAIVRAGHAVAIRNGAESWTPILIKSPRFGCEVLAVDVAPAGRGAARLSVAVAGVTAEAWAEYRARFLFLAKPVKDEVVRVASGALLTGDRFRGRLYVKGIFVQEKPDLRYGYDLDDADVDRDRKMIEGWDRDRKLAAIWNRALGKQPSLTAAFGDLLAEEAADVKYIGEGGVAYVPDAVAAKLAGAFVRQHGRKAIPVANIAEAADIEHLGRRGVVLPKGLMAVIAGKVGSFQSVQADLANEVVRKLSWSELTPAMRGNLARALDLVRLTGEDVPLDLVDVVEFRSDDIDGMFAPGKGGRISLAARVVRDAGECLATMIHEVAHRRGHDGDKGHVAAIESMWAAIAVKLLERVETAEAAAAQATTTAAEAVDGAADATAVAGVVRKARPAPVAGATASEWGRAGTAAEAFRRLIMTNGVDGAPALTDAQIFARVLAELGPERAGHPEHVGWYRCQLRKQGKPAPAAVK